MKSYGLVLASTVLLMIPACGSSDDFDEVGGTSSPSKEMTSQQPAAGTTLEPTAPPAGQANAAADPPRANVQVTGSPYPLQFGQVQVGGSVERTVRFESQGPDMAANVITWLFNLDDKTPYVNAEGGPSPFSVVSNDCTGAAGSRMTLAPGEACTLVIRFAPTKAKKSNSQVLFAANPGPSNLVGVTVFGEGIAGP